MLLNCSVVLWLNLTCTVIILIPGCHRSTTSSITRLTMQIMKREEKRSASGLTSQLIRDQAVQFLFFHEHATFPWNIGTPIIVCGGRVAKKIK
jgi:hypothetical protein